MKLGSYLALAITVVLIGLFTVGLSSCHNAGAPSPGAGVSPWRAERAPGPPATWDERGEWITNDLCEICHPETVEEFLEASHARLLESVDVGGTGCEACHGPGEEHEADEDGGGIDKFSELSQLEIANRCSRCHFGDLRQLDSERKHSVASKFPCTDCHQIHPPSADPDPEEEPKRAAIEKEIRECRVCHEDALKTHLRSNHARLVAGENAVGCHGCHGDGSEHARSGGLAAIDRPTHDQQKEICADCHQQRPSHARWLTSAHHKEGLDCLDCHNLLQPTGTLAKTDDEMELCGGCHNEVASKFKLQHHHPVPEGGMRCTSCHNPHHGRKSALSKRNMERRCAECHRTQTGPFVYEHQAGRVDGCQACHDPHGSSHPRMLTSWPTRNLCLSCHPNTPLNHNQASFSPFRECVTCHTEVHGSDIDRRLWR